ncbi:MAG: 1-deoxy-D-xylulose-5-phosphate synthase [Synergistetes bacterium]|nr:1-deoxy-D-xylulose-5-phosphate synthase [Synergistota bacterium]MCX8127563.1 1-deoxy-D-xylulose-5-phosphate synthase [Synergistota bacterium]MDW8191520.1 1-deoxy-D-xylulose-5-phosphate synthase [Synergistota bacterium]
MILEKIENIEDLRKLSLNELKLLASEIREKIVDVVGNNGGHLASNLGVVELTIALLRVWDPFKDYIIWDVGHQCYPFKILTGRKALFNTIRKRGGLSGFPNPNESLADRFIVGHSGTSLSWALGLVLSGKSDVVAIIGDGSLMSGMALEALNHIGVLKRKLIIILNDNEMAIGPRVGAIASHLARLRLRRGWLGFKKRVRSFVRNLPLGRGLEEFLEDLKGRFRKFLIKGSIFEELGLIHWGPIDGHDIELMERVFRNAKEVDKPVVIHVLTKKGKGYSPAEKDPETFHGAPAFKIVKKEEGESYSSIFGKVVLELASKDERVVCLTAAMKKGTGLDEFAKRYPSRFIDVGIAEQHMLGLAAGLARGGLKPIVAIYSTFLQRAYDQLIHDIALQKLPVIIAVDRGGIVGDDGPTHHGVFDLVFLRCIPNLIIGCPRDGVSLRDMFHMALNLDCPVVIRYPRGYTKVLPEWEKPPGSVEIGKSQVIRDGSEGVAFSLGPTHEFALGLTGFKVIDLAFAKPLDTKAIVENALKFDKICVFEEGARIGGVGEEIGSLLISQGIFPKEFNIFAIPDRFIEHGERGELLGELFWVQKGKNR